MRQDFRLERARDLDDGDISLGDAAAHGLDPDALLHIRHVGRIPARHEPVQSVRFSAFARDVRLVHEDDPTVPVGRVVRAKEQRDVEVACEVDQVRLAAQVLEARQYLVVAEIRRVLPRELDPALLGIANVEAHVVDLVELAVEARRDPWEALRFAAIDASGSQFVGPADQSGQQVLELIAWWEDANSLLTPARLRSRSTPVDSSTVRL